MPEEKVKMYLSGLVVDPRTKKTFEDWRELSRRTKIPMFEQMLLFCIDNGFDPTSDRVSWREGE